MMRVIFLLLVSSIALQSKSQTWNNYLQKRFKSYGIWADSILLLPSDTTINKAAKSLAVKNGNLYIANGNYWTEISGGSGGTGKVYADYGLINVNDSTLKVDSLQLTTLAKSYKIVDSLDKLYLKLTGGIVTGTVDIQQPLSLGEGGVSRGRLNFFNEDNGNTGSLSSIPYTSNREWLLPDYDGTLTTEDSLRSKTDSLLNIINGRATFGDVRDIVHDTANVLVRIADTASMLTPYLRKVDTTAMLTPYVTKSTTQTITGYKTYDTGIVIRANNQDSTLNINKSLILKNGTSAELNTIKMPPAIIFDGNAYQSDKNIGGFLQSQSNNVRWKIENLPKTGNANSNTFNSYLDFSYSLNNGAWNRKMRIGMFGLEADISSNTLNLGGTGQNGVINLYRAAGGGAQISATSLSGIAMYSSGGLYLYWGSFHITDGQPTNGTKITQLGTYITNYNAANGTPPSGGLQVVGKTILSGLATNYRYINDSSYTLTTTTKQINVAATTKNVYINLLTSVGNGGQEWSVRRESDTNQYKVIIKPTSGQKINGADSLILFAQNNNVTLKSDGANYIIVDRYNTAKANTPAAAADLSNISSVTPKKRIYTQTDSVVSVTEYYEVTLTTAGTASSFAVKTPIPTTFTSVYDAIGVGAVTIVDDFTTPTTRKSASAVITSVNASNKVLIQLNDDADSGNTKRIVTLNYQYILK